jgi:predicted transcriptional regulator
MAQVQLIVEVEEDLKKTLKELADKEERTLKVYVTRILKAAIAKSDEVAA